MSRPDILSLEPPTAIRAVLALGSNLGERSETLADAVAELVDHAKVRLCDVSPIVQTEPVGGPEDQPPYLNMVMEVETTLSPLQLLAHAHSVEQLHHRERVVRWGPRTLDVDIITYGTLLSEDPELTLPHPRAAERAFVLVPWLLMNSQAQLNGQSVRQLAANAQDLDGVDIFDEELS